MTFYYTVMTLEKKPGKLVPLEGLRGIAAVIVMLGHMVRGLVPPDPGNLDMLKRVHARAAPGASLGAKWRRRGYDIFRALRLHSQPAFR